MMTSIHPAALPLALLRPLGTANTPDPGGGGTTPLPRHTVAADWPFTCHAVIDRSAAIVHAVGVETLAVYLADRQSAVVDVGQLHQGAVSIPERLWRVVSSRSGQMLPRSTCQPVAIDTARPLRIHTRPQVGRMQARTGCLESAADAPRLLSGCRPYRHGISRRIGGRTPARVGGEALGRCLTHRTTPARTVPGDFYPLPILEPPEPPNLHPCGLPPPSGRLPLRLSRRHIAHHPAMVPLPLACAPRDSMPVLKAYIMLNHISVSADGHALQAIRVQIRTDMAAFCWQGSVTLYPDDFAWLDMDNRGQGDERIITVTVHDEAFVFMAEEYSDNRVFGQRSYTVSGRSLTARLGADYARTRSGVLEGSRYARQIAAEQLDLLPFGIAAWHIPDWLVPGGSYSISDSTPIGVLTDIARAAGGFVESHPSLPQLGMRPRWSVPAWRLGDAVPDATVPDSVMVSVSGQKQVNPRYNSVHVWADHPQGQAADVYRQTEDRSARAPALVHALYTDAPVLSAAGIAVLSDSGTHKIETVQLPISPEYALPRAQLGQLWQFNEPSGHWRGVVTGIGIEADCQNDGAVSLWQYLTVDRYLDQ